MSIDKEKYFANKYRTQSHRMPHWDYSAEGMYFITLVTQGRKCNLGEIVNQTMILTDWGKIVDAEWNNSFDIRTELYCDEYIIMPNHLHAIVIIDGGTTHVETHGRASLCTPFTDTTNTGIAYRKPKSISSFVAGFKSAVNSKIDDDIDNKKLDMLKYNRNNHFWQPNYHDHIIRDDAEYNRIKKYIINNPSNWIEDTLCE